MRAEDYMLPCINKTLFGFECMGCGAQRALLLISEGEFIKAFYMFPAIYTTILLFLFLGLNFIDKLRNYRKIIVLLVITNVAIMTISYIYKLTTFQ